MSIVRNGPLDKTDDSSGEMLKSVLLVDDHAVMRYGLQRLFEREFPNAVIGEARSGAEALDLLRQSKWQLMLLDMMMPDCDGVEVLNRIRLISCCETKVLILTGTCDPHLAALALKAGAYGYVTKCGSFDEIPLAVKAVLSGKRYLSRDISQEIVFKMLHGAIPEGSISSSASDHLSKREFHVLQNMAEGKSIKEIAALLGLSVKTVSTYRARMFKKLNFKSTADLVRYAVRENIIRN